MLGGYRDVECYSEVENLEERRMRTQCLIPRPFSEADNVGSSLIDNTYFIPTMRDTSSIIHKKVRLTGEPQVRLYIPPNKYLNKRNRDIVDAMVQLLRLQRR